MRENREPRPENRAVGQNLEPRTKNQAYSYRNLVLWEKAQLLALTVIQRVAKLPADPAARIMAQQIIRSVTSIGANIAEGPGRYALPAHRNYLSIAKASTCETDSWLDLLRRAGYLDAGEESHLHEACGELIRMLTGKMLQMERLQSTMKRTAAVREPKAFYSPADYGADDSVLGSRF